MEEKRMKMFEDIKERLNHCENRICHFRDLTLDLEDGSKMRCRCAHVADGGDLIVTMVAANGDEVEFWREELDFISHPNAIFNAISWPNPLQDVLDELDMKLGAQPKMPYVFPETFRVELEDGNKFDCIKVEYLNEDCGTICVTLYSEATDEFDLPADEFFTADALQEIADNIMIPRDIIVSVVDNENDGMVLYSKTVMNYITPEEVRDILEKAFPTFDWEKDGGLQFVYRDKNDPKRYVLATCEEL